MLQLYWRCWYERSLDKDWKQSIYKPQCFYNKHKNKKITTRIFIQDLGVYCAEGTPVPIPNTEVKLCCVDGTASLDVGE